MKKVLWLNHTFLDYRIPVYAELNKMFQGNFHLFSSRQNRPHIKDGIKRVLNENVRLLKTYRITLFSRSQLSNESLDFYVPVGMLRKGIKINPNIIICEGFGLWTIYGLVIALLCDSDLWIAYERTKFTERNCPYWRLAYRKLISLNVAGFLVNGVETENYLQEVIEIGSEAPIIRDCMSADSSHFASKVLSARRELVGNRECVNYLFVGSLDDRKGIKQLLEAWSLFEKDKSVMLSVVGIGPLYEELQSTFGHIESVKLKGFIPYDNIHLSYADADCFILPTLEDNWSLVIPEAMASGLPVATTRYNGCHPELVRDNGYLFDCLDLQSIIECLDYLYRNKGSLLEMGEISKEIEKHYTPIQVSKRIYRAVGGQ